LANPTNTVDADPTNSGQARLAQFRISGLFGSDGEIVIDFPSAADSITEPTILILSGKNGTGKTTILRMISGMLHLDFDLFRVMPFSKASLSLISGEKVTISWNPKADDFPLTASFAEHTVTLARDRHNARYSTNHIERITSFREDALPILGGVNYVLLEVDRSPDVRRARLRRGLDPRTGLPITPERDEVKLSIQVRNFLREAQVDYSKFFRSEELDLMPRILERLKDNRQAPGRSDLLNRVQAIRDRYPIMLRYGLQTEEDELSSMDAILHDDQYQASAQISLIETYIEIQEGIQKRRDAITSRLEQFELIMDEFLSDKVIRVDSRRGLTIEARGKRLDEDDLSSGEYHFLFMMVSALLCRRSGSILAIDEPELSLHISWQRKLVGALAKCAAGASPLFLFATHSLAISAEHADQVLHLSQLD
jgi:ABC-type cobalamin/Fe3+-siderophores transport system ATPase subunit